MKAARQKKCAICGNKFQPQGSFDKTCADFECKVKYGEKAAEKSKANREKAERIAAKESRKVIRMKLETMKPLSYWADKTQRAVNAYIRELRKGMPCISCGKHRTVYDVGHYRSRGASPATRYVHENLWLQCIPCNQHKSGNAIEYRINLVKKIGLERVEWLEGPHEPPRWRKEDYLRIEAEHKALLAELKNQGK